jgi:hypothetical protein
VSFIIRVREKEGDKGNASLDRYSSHPERLFIKEGYEFDHNWQVSSVPCALIWQVSPDKEPDVLLWANKSDWPIRDLMMCAHSEARRLRARGYA